jgi:hypothetical protein
MMKLMKMLLREYLLVLVTRNDLYYLLISSHFSDGYSVKIENGSFRWSNLANDPLVLKQLVNNQHFLYVMTNFVDFHF